MPGRGDRAQRRTHVTLGGKVIYDQGWRVADLRALRRDQISFVFRAPYLSRFWMCWTTLRCC